MDKIILETLAAEALKKIDIDAFAAKIAPKLLAALEKNLTESIRDYDFSDLLYDRVFDEKFSKMISGVLARALSGKE